MEAQDYRNNGFVGDGMLTGMGVSILAHVVVILLALGAPVFLPHLKVDPPLCTVNLIGIHDLRGGRDEGALTRGDGEPQPAGGAAVTPPSAEPEAEPEPEQHKIDSMQLAMATEENVTLTPVPQKIETPVEKPKPKSKLKPKLPRKQQAISRPQPSPTVPPVISSENPGALDFTVSGKGEGLGERGAEGTGSHHSGEGTGGGHGPYSAAFGSKEGPRFVIKVLPRYPRIARELGQEGVVELLVTIDEHGRLVNVEIHKRAGSGFDEETLQAVKKSTFSPAKRNGKPVLCKAHLPIRLVLRGADED